jgi:hypothetical protein
MNKKILVFGVVLLGLGVIGYGRIVGNWTSSLNFRPQTPAVIDQALVSSSSTMIVGCFWGIWRNRPAAPSRDCF